MACISPLGLLCGLGCLAALVIGFFMSVCFWFDSQPGAKASNPIPVVTQHDYDSNPDGVWIKLPDGRVLKKGQP